MYLRIEVCILAFTTYFFLRSWWCTCIRRPLTPKADLHFSLVPTPMRMQELCNGYVTHLQYFVEARLQTAQQSFSSKLRRATLMATCYFDGHLTRVQCSSAASAQVQCSNAASAPLLAPKRSKPQSTIKIALSFCVNYCCLLASSACKGFNLIF